MPAASKEQFVEAADFGAASEDASPEVDWFTDHYRGRLFQKSAPLLKIDFVVVLLACSQLKPSRCLGWVIWVLYCGCGQDI
jgi:hypothetical protein